jgi:hypothetical protein
MNAPDIHLAIVRALQSAAALVGKDAVVRFFSSAAADDANDMLAHLPVPILPPLKEHAVQHAESRVADRFTKLLTEQS